MSDSLERYIHPTSLLVSYSGPVYNDSLEVVEFDCNIVEVPAGGGMFRPNSNLNRNIQQYRVNNHVTLEQFREQINGLIEPTDT